MVLGEELNAGGSKPSGQLARGKALQTEQGTGADLEVGTSLVH